MKRHAATGFWTVLTLGGVLLCVTAGGPAQAGTWTSNGPYGGVVVSLLIDPTNPQVVYAGTEGPGAVKTTDGGATWIGVNDGLIWNRVRALAFEPGNPATIYAGTLSDGVCKSTSSGASWSELNDGLPPECLAIRALHVAASASQTWVHADAGAGVYTYELSEAPQITTVCPFPTSTVGSPHTA